MMTKLILNCFILLLLAGCSKPVMLIEKNKYQAKPAELIGYSVDDRYVYIDVVSRGCTMITSFELRLVSVEENSFEVVRKHPDECRMKPLKMSINYPFRHLGLDPERPLLVKNRVDKQLLASR
jgi:hypothetical protein